MVEFSCYQFEAISLSSFLFLVKLKILFPKHGMLKIVGDSTLTLIDNNDLLYLSECKPYLTSWFCRVELDL